MKSFNNEKEREMLVNVGNNIWRIAEDIKCISCLKASIEVRSRDLNEVVIDTMTPIEDAEKLAKEINEVILKTVPSVNIDY